VGTIRALGTKGTKDVAKTASGGWLFKEEPDHYAYEDLERDGEVVWEGVKNAVAVKHLRQVQAGDRVLYYHTGKVRAIVGEARVAEGDPEAGAVKIKPVKRWKRSVSLERIKKEPSLASWELVRISRLSVMPVTAEQWQKVVELRDEAE